MRKQVAVDNVPCLFHVHREHQDCLQPPLVILTQRIWIQLAEVALDRRVKAIEHIVAGRVSAISLRSPLDSASRAPESIVSRASANRSASRAAPPIATMGVSRAV